MSCPFCSLYIYLYIMNKKDKTNRNISLPYQG